MLPTPLPPEFSPPPSGNGHAKLALVLPFLALAIFCLNYGNPFALKYSDWGPIFMLCLMLGGAGAVGMILSLKAIARGQHKGIAYPALVLNALAVLGCAITLLG